MERRNNYILETDRLILREFTLSDASFIGDLLNSPGWLQYIGDRNVKNEEQACQYLENGPMKSYQANGYGLWLVQLKHENIPVGMCGIINRNYLENPDIGFAFLPEFTGQGFAFEIASATMNYAKEVLKLPAIFAITVPHNERSIRLLNKIGLQYQRQFLTPDSGEELMLFSS